MALLGSYIRKKFVEVYGVESRMLEGLTYFCLPEEPLEMRFCRKVDRGCYLGRLHLSLLKLTG